MTVYRISFACNTLTILIVSFNIFRRLHFEIGKRRMADTLVGAKNNCLLPFFKNCVVEGLGIDLLKELDKGMGCPTRLIKILKAANYCMFVNWKNNSRGNYWSEGIFFFFWVLTLNAGVYIKLKLLKKYMWSSWEDYCDVIYFWKTWFY